MESYQGDIILSDDPGRQQLAVIHGYLTQSYWAKGISQGQVAKAMAGSYCFGLFHGDQQIGFGRLITDRASFAYLADVFVLAPYQGQGLARWMLQSVFAQQWCQGLRRILLVTRDAQGLYRQLGFVPPANPEGLMELHKPGIYQENCMHTIKENA
ncbi:GNAT family N-acetyltransferase [Gallaecimonas xiamenensis]|uniref:Acetyltransferase n=1 Tax=Gallaecimonas xiamenensis 3-C-1 TaxID=745411 RepID=K2J4S2_9GAMM|nr:GNAT family N-acetyltransferase [Gallaecimonas xiamenensis]EKE69912.1 acetyltransferase [Gallaecimonas xiamenensis 3-C-1]